MQERRTGRREEMGDAMPEKWESKEGKRDELTESWK
jgi:hypothetical protein